MSFSELNKIYMKHLLRPIDLDGYNRYSKAVFSGELTIGEIENLITQCEEISLVSKRMKSMNDIEKYTSECFFAFDSQKIPKHKHFHVVVSRYNENINWITFFENFNCHVFLYNKGEKINLKMSNLTVIDVDNISYEDYVYLKHIITFYSTYERQKYKIVFMQGGIDHCPNIMKVLCNIDNFKRYESLFESIGISSSWAETSSDSSKMMFVDCQMHDVGGGESYVREFKRYMDIRDSNVYVYICKTIGVVPLFVPLYSPCGVFASESESITTNNISVYLTALEFITSVHYKTNPIITKVAASVFERMWFTIMTQ